MLKTVVIICDGAFPKTEYPRYLIRTAAHIVCCDAENKLNGMIVSRFRNGNLFGTVNDCFGNTGQGFFQICHFIDLSFLSLFHFGAYALRDRR